ncbi:MAG: hypothetical protein ACYCWW_19630, partial [Deltaproteobacteria bacterium]
MTHLSPPGKHPRSILAAALGAAAIVGLLTLPPPTERAAAPALATPRVLSLGPPLLAGAAAVPLPLRERGPLGGYGPLRGGARGERDPPLARAIALGELDLVELDVVELPEQLVDELRRRRPGETVIAFASHTHSGPGGFDPRLLARLLGMGR